MTLTFVETKAAPGERVFDVTANGKPALSDFDVVQTAGGPLVAVRRTFAVDVDGGMLDLGFRPKKGQAIVSAVEVQR